MSVSIKLDNPTALVLFELLARWEQDTQSLEVRDASEEYALLQVMGGLEKALQQPFDPQYRSLVESARLELRKRTGN